MAKSAIVVVGALLAISFGAVTGCGRKQDEAPVDTTLSAPAPPSAAQVSGSAPASDAAIESEAQAAAAAAAEAVSAANAAATSANEAAADEQNSSPRISSAYRNCMAGGEDGVACANAENQRQDQLLNAVYRRLMATVPNAEGKAALRQEELSWIKDRDSECVAEATNDGQQPVGPETYAHCELDARVKRLQELGARLSQ